jgi:hypothetical protein
MTSMNLIAPYTGAIQQLKMTTLIDKPLFNLLLKLIDHDTKKQL